MLKKWKFGFFTIALIFSTCTSVYAAENVKIKQATFATVVSVIDGETVKVKVFGTKDTAIVSLLGVDPTGYEGAKAYLEKKLTGKLVSLTFDTNTPVANGRFNIMILTNGEVNINKEMIEKGYAAIDKNQTHASFLTSAFLQKYAPAVNYENSGVTNNGYQQNGYNNTQGTYTGKVYYYNAERGYYYSSESDSDRYYYDASTGQYYNQSTGTYYQGSYFNQSSRPIGTPSSDGFYYRNGKKYKFMNGSFYEYVDGLLIPSNEWF